MSAMYFRLIFERLLEPMRAQKRLLGSKNQPKIPEDPVFSTRYSLRLK
jgi:hypothetical protein